MKGLFKVAVGFVLAVMVSIVGYEGRAEALTVTSLDFTSGAANWDGRNGRMLDRLLARDGSITMGSYQSTTEIVDPITRGRKSYSLFTSGFNGAPAPSATINGSSISVDLSSLYFGWTRGSEVHAWNIGGIAKGLINPETLEFCLSWEHLFSNRNGGEKQARFLGEPATFFLQGKAAVGAASVALSASAVFYAIGLAGIGGFFWRRQTVMTA